MTSPLAETNLHWQIPVAHWANWTAGIGDSASPDVAFVDAMTRRRLSRLAKMALKVAHDCSPENEKVRVVFASRHGELTRTVNMLDDLAQNQPLSPTAFSQSVLNASAGLFSILRGDTSEATAISAADSSFGFGLLEAALQYANNPSSRVLFIYADEPAPSIYGEEAMTGPAHALAILLGNESRFDLECGMAADSDTDTDAPHSLVFLESLVSGASGKWHGEGRCWTWKAR